MREVRREVRDLRFVREAMHARKSLRRVQLRVFPRQVCHMRRLRYLGCLLLQRVHTTRERPRWLSQDREPRKRQDGLVL